MATTASRPPGWYWLMAALALVWMLFGVFAWIMDLRMDEAALHQFSAAQRELYLLRPQWLFIVYGVAIFSGLLGAVGLMLRKLWALPALLLSLLAVIVQFGYTFAVMDAMQRLGAAQALPFPLLIFSIGVALVWFAVHARRHRWIS